MNSCVTHKTTTSTEEKIYIIIRQMGESISKVKQLTANKTGAEKADFS
jgi:hypothetical protein